MASTTHRPGARPRPAPPPPPRRRPEPAFSFADYVAGIAPVVFGMAGLVVLEGPGDRPEFDAPRGQLVAYFGRHDPVIAGGFLLALAAVCFLWFTGALRAVLRTAEGEPGRLAGIAYAGGVTAAASMLMMPASAVVGALYAPELTPASAQTFFLFGNVFLYPATLGSALLIGVTGLVALRRSLLPPWLALSSLVLAVWLLVPPLGPAGTPENPASFTGLSVLPGVAIWSAVTAFVLLVRRP